jgi:hypothetical protein
MSDTAELFTLAGIWTLGALFVAYFIPKWPAKIAAVAFLVGIPFWELPYGYYNFRQLCVEEAKFQVFEEITPQDGICVENLDAGLYKNLSNAGFVRIEVMGSTDDLQRDNQSGRVFFSKNQKAESKYCLQFIGNIPLPWRILRHDLLVTNSSDRRVVGRQSRFIWAGMWWQERASPVFGSGGSCFDDPSRAIRYVRSRAG